MNPIGNEPCVPVCILDSSRAGDKPHCCDCSPCPAGIRGKRDDPQSVIIRVIVCITIMISVSSVTMIISTIIMITITITITITTTTNYYHYYYYYYYYYYYDSVALEDLRHLR